MPAFSCRKVPGKSGQDVGKAYGKCQFFRDSLGTVYGVGFNNYFDLLSHKEAKTAYTVLQWHFKSRTQFGRYRSGQLRISPGRKAEIDALLKANGVSIPLECDAYEVGL